MSKAISNSLKWIKKNNPTLLIILFFSLLINTNYLYNKIVRKLSSKQENFSTNIFFQIKNSEYEALSIDSNSIVFLGTSLTQCFDVTEFFNNLSIKNRGICKDVTAGVLNRLDNVLAGKPKKIFLEIGITDLLDNVPPNIIADSILKIVTIITTHSPNTKLYIQSLFPSKYEKRKNLIADIKRLNEEIRVICNRQNIFYINLFDPFYSEEGLNPEYDSGDHLHLNGKGYLKWKYLIQEYI